MALVGTALLDKVTEDNPAAVAFRPWWESTKNYLEYTLIILDLVTMPTAMFLATPLDCQVCKVALRNCDFMHGMEGFNPVGNKTTYNETTIITDPKYNA